MSIATTGGDRIEREIPDHEISGTRFFVRFRSRGCDVFERGAGIRGAARHRARCRNLADALRQAEGMAPSTVKEILAQCPPRPALYDRLIALCEPGTRLWIMPGSKPGYGRAAVSTGLALNAAEALFGTAGDSWLVGWRFDDGTTGSGLYAVAYEDAERAWWVVRDGHIVAGGPPIYDEARAREIAARYGAEVVAGSVITAGGSDAGKEAAA